MKLIRDYIGQELQWGQPNAIKMNYELLAGGERIATLEFRSTFGSLATAKSADGCWTFKRVGFFATRVTIRTCGYETNIASFKNNTWSGGGTLQMADGREYLASTNFWQTKYEFRTGDGQPLLQFNHGGVFHASAVLQVEKQALEISEFPWMVMLGWYLVLLLRQDSAVVATI